MRNRRRIGVRSRSIGLRSFPSPRVLGIWLLLRIGIRRRRGRIALRRATCDRLLVWLLLSRHIGRGRREILRAAIPRNRLLRGLLGGRVRIGGWFVLLRGK